jgi:hypothetical protein
MGKGKKKYLLHLWCAHILQESFGLHLNLQHISDELSQKLQLEAPGLGSFHGKVPLFLQPKDHPDQA